MTTPTQAQIEAALGGHNHVFKNGRCIACDLTEKQINAITAAAEVGEKEITSVDVALAVEAATIERCAQEGVEFLRGLVGVWRKKNGRITRFVAADCLEQAIDGYASAIRALKDS